MKKNLFISFLLILFTASNLWAEKTNFHGIKFNNLPQLWDEGIPLGNGIMGTLIWEKGDNLRLALDRADLWDLRPVKEFESENYSFDFVCNEIINKKDISKVHEMIDARTRKDVAPTKIPAGAIEIPIKHLGKVKDVTLDVHTAICTVEWENGVVARFFTDATDKVGHFKFENLSNNLSYHIYTPKYKTEGQIENVDRNGENMLTKLGYEKGDIHTGNNMLVYKQQAFGDISYEVALKWDYKNDGTAEGVYVITTKGTWYSEAYNASDFLKSYKKNFDAAIKGHCEWWNNYWAQSEIKLQDDAFLENQWYLEMYKFGAASQKMAPPICLQAVWTADNGQTPPWRGDFHNDLNTQLSYWPGYASNHLTEASVFTDWLWKIKDNGHKWTKRFFGVEGLNIPCIATLEGTPIGGWSAYSHQPSTSGWLAHHFYLQWKYSADEDFLRNRAYPWVKEAARYFDNIAIEGEDGKYKLALSTSPEINDNRIEAWFQEMTNYDLANIQMAYTAAFEMAEALGLKKDAKHWKKQLTKWPSLSKDKTGLTIAPNYPLTESHRHLSHLLAIHPFGLLDVSQGKEAEELIKKSINHFEKLSPAFWCGYSYSWMANMKARILDGDGAVRALHIFSKAFCSPNSFHLNGDQLKKGYSSLTYRPFTLEGNFACAAGIQELLIQSHTGTIHVFPALPSNWKNASFKQMRARGAFLVDATYANGKVSQVSITAEKGGKMKWFNPFTQKVEEKKMKVGETYSVKATN